jgi:hypothetical protein
MAMLLHINNFFYCFVTRVVLPYFTRTLIVEGGIKEFSSYTFVHVIVLLLNNLNVSYRNLQEFGGALASTALTITPIRIPRKIYTPY